MLHSIFPIVAKISCWTPAFSARRVHLSLLQSVYIFEGKTSKATALDLFFMLRGEVGSFRMEVFISPVEQSRMIYPSFCLRGFLLWIAIIMYM